MRLGRQQYTSRILMQMIEIEIEIEIQIEIEIEIEIGAHPGD